MTGFGHYMTLFAAAIPENPLGKTPALLLKDVLLIIGAALALLVLLLVWAKYLRNAKPKRRRRGGQKVFRGSKAADEPEESEESTESNESAAEARRRYKFRYKRRDHRSRNPTLAETGGLPPVRPEQPTKPS